MQGTHLLTCTSRCLLLKIMRSMVCCRWVFEDDLVDFPIESANKYLTFEWTSRDVASGRLTFAVRSSKPQYSSLRHTCHILYMYTAAICTVCVMGVG